MEAVFSQNNLDLFYEVHRVADAALVEGDCLQILKLMPDNSVDSIVTDPPYGLSFMGKRWDYDVPSTEVWAECLRVLKPGGHLLAFAGTRTQHRMAVRIEDAGFEIRDMIAWVYSTGFPKSHNLQGDWQGWGSALKPSHEPVTVARKPLVGTVAENVLAHGTGALNIDGCRVGTAGGTRLATATKKGDGIYEGGINTGAFGEVVPGLGRWPANLIHDGSDDVLHAFPGAAESSAARFFQRCEGVYDSIWQDQNPTTSSAGTAVQSSCLLNHLAATVQNAVAIWPSLAGILSSEQTAASTPVTLNESKAISETAMQAMSSIASGFSQESQHERRTPCGSLVRTAATQRPTGTTTITTSLCKSDGSVGVATFTITPSNLDRGEAVCRFSYCAKASKRDRDEGLQPGAVAQRQGNRPGSPDETGKFPDHDHRERTGNFHPTVKPTDLMAYLCRLVTPPGGVVLDPFMGSGSTGKAAMREGFKFIGCELSPEYMEIARARVASAVKN